jgi:hypothetical protein
VDNELMNGQPSGVDRDAQLMRGLPQTLHSPPIPSGQIEQAGKIADGLRVRHVGWRRIVVPVGLALIACAMVASLMAWILTAR